MEDQPKRIPVYMTQGEIIREMLWELKRIGAAVEEIYEKAMEE